jgi:L-lysine 2,3-aminomutase
MLQQAGLGAALDSPNFAQKIPPGFVARMKKGDPLDPLLLQVLPLAAENAAVPGFVSDPVGDLAKNPIAGLVHKYRSRVLLISTGACAIHCRYCFRREFPYAERGLTSKQLQAIVEHIRAHAEVNEVILSGGDPLSLSDRKLAEITEAFSVLPQIKRLRIHSRTPVVLPERIDAGFMRWIGTLPRRNSLK